MIVLNILSKLCLIRSVGNEYKKIRFVLMLGCKNCEATLQVIGQGLLDCALRQDFAKRAHQETSTSMSNSCDPSTHGKFSQDDEAHKE